MTSNDVMDVAMEWLVIMKSSAKAELRRAEFEAWLRQDPSHRIAYGHVSRYWNRLDNAVALLQQGDPSTPEALLGEISDVARRNRRRRDARGKVKWWATRVACVLAVGVLVLIARYILSAREVQVG